MTTGLWVLLAYAAGLVALGAWIGRRVGRAGSFFVADRKLGPVLLFATVLAANLGAGTTVGAAGLGYRDGLSAWWWVGSAGIGTILLALCGSGRASGRWPRATASSPWATTWTCGTAAPCGC